MDTPVDNPQPPVPSEPAPTLSPITRASPVKKWVSIGIAILIVLVLLGVAGTLYWRAQQTDTAGDAMEKPENGTAGTLPITSPLTSPQPELLTEASSSDSPIVNTLTEIDTLESSLNALGSDTEL